MAYDGSKPINLDQAKMIVARIKAEYEKTLPDQRTEAVDLTVEFADEIAKFESVWDWVQFRVINANTDDMIAGDWIPTTVGSTSANAYIRGINTYFGNYLGPLHIDFGIDPLSGYKSAWATTLNNNGDTASPYPWLASELYDYMNNTVFYDLPEALQKVIIDKYSLIESRYSDTDSELTKANGWGWTRIGKLWTFTEVEVFGTCTYTSETYGGYGHKYPYFDSNTLSTDSDCWLMSVVDGLSENAVTVTSSGEVGSASVTEELSFPICFRIGVN